MKKSLIIMACAAVVASSLESCSNSELTNSSNPNEEIVAEGDWFMNIEAEVGGDSAGNSRTSTNVGNSSVVFVDADEIGMFLPGGEPDLVKWTYNGSLWSAEHSVQWENKVDDFEFLAFYPYITGAVKTAVPMPELSNQTGLIDNIGDKDFLVARKTEKYATNSGKVSFTGDNAFRHVYSLVYLTVKKEQETDILSISNLKLSATDIASKCTYSFGARQEDDAVNRAESAIDEIVIDYSIAVSVGNEGHNVAILVNSSLMTENAIKFSMTYTRDDKQYTSSVDINNVTGNGKIHKVVLKLKREGLTIEGSSILDWSVNNLDEIDLSESPAQ